MDRHCRLIRQLLFASAVWIMAGTCFAQVIANPPLYNITALDVLTGTLDSVAYGFNGAGDIVGASTLDRSGDVGQSRPVVWNSSGQPRELWSDQSLGASLAGINIAGEIVGTYGNRTAGPPPIGDFLPYGRAFYWSASTGLTDIGLTATGNSQAVAINGLGRVAGTSETLDIVNVDGTPTPQYMAHAFIWDKTNGIRAIGNLSGGDSSLVPSTAKARSSGTPTFLVEQRHSFGTQRAGCGRCQRRREKAVKRLRLTTRGKFWATTMAKEASFGIYQLARSLLRRSPAMA